MFTGEAAVDISIISNSGNQSSFGKPIHFDIDLLFQSALVPWFLIILVLWDPFHFYCELLFIYHPFEHP